MNYPKIYAVDFDNTLAVTQFPEIIEPITPMIEAMKHLQNDGNIIILNTCRCGEDLAAAVAFCKDNGLEFDYINENVRENVEKFGNDSRKIFAHVYIDDKAWNPEEDLTDEMQAAKNWKEYEEAKAEFAQQLANIATRFADPIVQAAKRFSDRINEKFN